MWKFSQRPQIFCLSFIIRMQHLTKDILTTKITKATKGSEILNYKLRALRVLRGQICFAHLARGGYMLENLQTII
jgi:hypothetical protein